MLHVGVVLYEDPLDRLDRLSRALEVCRRAPGTVPFQLHVRDHSFSALKRPVAERLPGSRYSHAPENLGFAAGQNAMMKEAFAQGATDYAALNPDAVPHPDSLAELVAEKARHARPGLIEARQFPDEHPKPYEPSSHLTPWASGCMLLVTRGLYLALGGFDEHFFLYCEDVDLSWRARAADFQVALAPAALVHHYADDRGPGEVEKHMVLSGAYLARKYGARRFEQRCLARYLELAGQPAAVPTPPEVSRGALKVANFDHGFVFAERRW